MTCDCGGKTKRDADGYEVCQRCGLAVCWLWRTAKWRTSGCVHGAGLTAGCRHRSMVATRRYRSACRVAISTVPTGSLVAASWPGWMTTGQTMDDLREQAEALHPTRGAVMLEPRQVLALLDVAEAADEFWVGANDVMTVSHHDDIGGSYESLRAALVRLEEVRRDA